MSNQLATFSDPSSRLEPAAFQSHFRRLESLQTLMTQGGAVVSEVAAFLTRAREELHALQRDQESYAAVQQRLVEEKAELLVRVDALEAAKLRAEARAQEQDVAAAKLKAELASLAVTTKDDTAAALRTREVEAQLEGALAKVQSLEQTLQRERELRMNQVSKLKQEEVASHASEIAQLKTRLASVEQQLNTERDRRVRLMEVVKSHEVIVASHQLRQRESAL